MSAKKLFHPVKPEHPEIIGRLDNELDPNVGHHRKGLTYPIIGRVHNELNSSKVHEKTLPHPIIGRIYNELHPNPRERIERIGQIRQKIGRTNNEWVEPQSEE